ncbi:MAG: tyrosine-type recombinase/integrase [Candidatus Marinarcus sp.]|uniref:tyrosine-type recombinase/integrase n=1 Tax=Candidatus Marinarcus sp. TaxID=3100987 RepID=UPI003B0060DD
MRYPIDFLTSFDQTLLFWMERFIKLKLTTLSNRNVKDKNEFNAIIQKLNKGVKNINELKKLSKEARQCGLIGINTYINPLEKLYEQLQSLGFASMKEIDEETIIDFLATYTSGLSDATKKNYRMVVLSFFKYIDKQNEDDEGKSFIYRMELKNWGGLGGNKGQKLPTYMHDEEIERFLNAIEETPFKEYAQAKNRLLIKLILYTGMRVSEALDIQVKDIVKEDGFHIFRISGKGNKQRIAMIKSTYIQKDMNEWLDIKGSTPLLFCSRTQKRLTQPYVSYIMDKILLYAGIRKEKNGAHMLRHTFATRLYQKNHDLILVQEALGHADLNTSRIYTHFDKERLKAATSVMDDFAK